MSFKKIPTGKNIPHEVNVIIEIPAHSPPVKYEINKDYDAIFVDRFLSTAMFYPCNYGYIPQTLSADGDPTDVLVVTPLPLAIGCVIAVRPVGMLKMTDEAGVDVKLITVPINKLTNQYDTIYVHTDLPAGLLKSIEHFFTHYKAHEAGKWSKVDGWADIEAAKTEILASVTRYQQG